MQPRRRRHQGWLLIAALVVLVMHRSPPFEAQSAEPEPPVFETAVAPLLEAKCIRCHGELTRKSNLDLSSAESLRRGGESGAVIAPGNLKDSLLWQRIEADEMPPDGEKPRLTKAETERIRRWIESGARHTPPSELPGDSQHDILPIVQLRCTVCHGLRKQEGGLDLRTKLSMLKGGKSGPAIEVGDPENSLLVKRIRAGEMPPPRRVAEVSVKPVPASELDRIVSWIKAGAPEVADNPDVATTTPDPLVSDEDRNFWAFQPPRVSHPPAVRNASRVENPIDAFVLARLEAKGLSLGTTADRSTILRRAYFDLTGLPPTPEEAAAFLVDTSADAYERLVERLLDSPRYGERWGRYWLDVAGYCDSEGKTNQDLVRPWAYRYRDYVIRAFNSDKPYDRFLLEQIAGDELADYEQAAEITPEIYDNLVATGFLRMTADGTWANATNYVPDRLDVIADEIQVLSSGVLGLTLNCARCHSHRFDPIPQRDYYRLAAILKPALDENDWLGPTARYLNYVLPAEKQPVTMHNGPLEEQIAKLRSELSEAAAAAKQKLIDAYLAQLPEAERQALHAAMALAAPQRSEGQKQLLEKHRAHLELDDEALKQADAQFKQLAADVADKTKKLSDQKTPEPQIRALWDRGVPSPTYLLKRGDYLSPGRLVGPGVPSVLTDGQTPFQVSPPWPGAKSTGRRLAPARWLVRPDHALTARVMVNRIWAHHFGQGIVKSVGNFGHSGSGPSHPELLDWLAGQFVERGWSVKHMHRLMMTSSTYRQSSATRPDADSKDPDQSLLSRMPLKRLDAEALYDSLLGVSASLAPTPFGPPDPIDLGSDGLVTVKPSGDLWRRSVYVQQRRTQLPTLLDNFDFPQMSPNCLTRRESIVAPQALYLMNNPVVHELAQRFARRVVRQAGSNPKQQIELAYQIALTRKPTPAEAQTTGLALAELTKTWLQQPGGRRLVLEAVAASWIRESSPETAYDLDRIWVSSVGALDAGRRSGLVEFDLRQLDGLDIHRAHLELAVMSGGQIKQTAGGIAPGIVGATWSSYQTQKAGSLEPFESLGRYDAGVAETPPGGYVVSAPASAADLKMLSRKVADGQRLALALMASEDGSRYQREWDDGVAKGSRGKRPRLVGYGKATQEEAAQQALANVCHALLSSAQFSHID